jgi:hypothetical protein
VGAPVVEVVDVLGAPVVVEVVDVLGAPVVVEVVDVVGAPVVEVVDVVVLLRDTVGTLVCSDFNEEAASSKASSFLLLFEYSPDIYTMYRNIRAPKMANTMRVFNDIYFNEEIFFDTSFAILPNSLENDLAINDKLTTISPSFGPIASLNGSINVSRRRRLCVKKNTIKMPVLNSKTKPRYRYKPTPSCSIIITLTKI